MWWYHQYSVYFFPIFLSKHFSTFVLNLATKSAQKISLSLDQMCWFSHLKRSNKRPFFPSSTERCCSSTTPLFLLIFSKHEWSFFFIFFTDIFSSALWLTKCMRRACAASPQTKTRNRFHNFYSFKTILQSITMFFSYSGKMDFKLKCMQKHKMCWFMKILQSKRYMKWHINNVWTSDKVIIHWNVTNIGPLYSDDKNNGIKWQFVRKLYWPEADGISGKKRTLPCWISYRSVIVFG